MFYAEYNTKWMTSNIHIYIHTSNTLLSLQFIHDSVQYQQSYQQFTVFLKKTKMKKSLVIVASCLKATITEETLYPLVLYHYAHILI